MQQGFQKRKNLLDEKIYRVFIKYCVLSKILKYIPDSGLSRFSLEAVFCVCTQNLPSQKNHNFGWEGVTEREFDEAAA